MRLRNATTRDPSLTPGEGVRRAMASAEEVAKRWGIARTRVGCGA